MNPYRGETPLSFGGETYKIVFDWEAIALLQQEYGKKDFDSRVTQAWSMGDVHELAKILSIGLRKHHPDISPEMVMEASPPINVATEAVITGMHRAFNGLDPPSLQEEEQENPRNRRAKLLIWWGKLGDWLFGSASRRVTSGV